MNNFILVLLNIYLYFVFFIYSAVSIPLLVLVIAVMSLALTQRQTMYRIRRAIGWWGRGITLVPFPFIKVCYEDQSHENTGESYVYVCNHRSFSDGFLMSVLPIEGVQVVNIWPFKIPVIGFFAKLAGYLNIKMMESKEFFEMAIDLLKDNVSIIFFPEGTRSASKKMGNFHGAAFRLALQSRAAIAPLCISGNENIPPKGSLMFRPGTIRIRRLPAIEWKDYKDMDVFSLKNRVREIMDNELLLMENRT